MCAFITVATREQQSSLEHLLYRQHQKSVFNYDQPAIEQLFAQQYHQVFEDLDSYQIRCCPRGSDGRDFQGIGFCGDGVLTSPRFVNWRNIGAGRMRQGMGSFASLVFALVICFALLVAS